MQMLVHVLQRSRWSYAIAGTAGTEQGMHDTFGSTCHGAGRARSRNNSRNKLDYQEVLDALKTKGIAIRVASPKLVMEEAPESYKVCLGSRHIIVSLLA